MEEGVLCLQFSTQFLHVVDDQHVNLLIEGDEVVRLVLPHGISILNREQMS